MNAPLRSTSFVPAMIQVSRFETETGRLAVELRGHAIAGRLPLVLWPSLFSDRHMYDRLIPLLDRDHELILFDPPGHGESGLCSAPLTLAATARASLDALDRLGIGRVRWVGTSWGGMIGIHAALQAPNRIAHLACLNTPFDLGARPDAGTRFIVAGARWLGRTTLFANGVARSFFRPETLTTDPYFAAHQLAVFLKGDRHSLHRVAQHVLIERENLTPLLPSLTVPTLVLAARQDLYPSSAMQAAARLIPGGRFSLIEDSRHISAADAPGAVNAAMRGAWANADRPSIGDHHGKV
jgi:3-oxoadipate enol-lactonase